MKKLIQAKCHAPRIATAAKLREESAISVMIWQMKLGDTFR